MVDSLTELVNKQNINFITDTSVIANTACHCHILGIHYSYADNFPLSLNYYNKAIYLREKFNDGLLWKSYKNLGIAQRDYEVHFESVKSLEKARSLKLERPRDKIDVNRYLAQSYSKLGEFKMATECAERAIKIPVNTSRDTTRLANAFLDYSTILIEMNDNSKMNKAIEMADQAIYYFKNKINKLKATNHKGIAYRHLKQYSKSKKAYEEASDFDTEKDKHFKAEIFTNQGILFNDLNLPADAIISLNTSLKLKNEFLKNPPYHFSFAPNYNNLGKSYAALDKLGQALMNFHLAIVNTSNNFRSENVFDNPFIDDELYLFNNIDFVEYLDSKGKTAFKIYEKTDDLKYLDLAKATYEVAFNFHNRLYDEITTESSRLTQAKTIMPYIENALKVQYEYKLLENKFDETAFKFMELNKATVLTQSIAESNALEKAGIPKDLLRKEKGLRIKIASIQKGIKSKDQNQENSLLNKYKEEYISFINNLESTYPIYKKLKYQPSKFDLNQLQNKIDNSKAVLEYFIGDTSIYVLAIQKEQADFFQIKKPDYWETLIDSLHSVITEEKNLSIFSNTAHELYNLIVEKPIECLDTSKIKHLQIIPDGKLNRIPFAVLVSELKPSSNDAFSKLHYLANQFNISYGFSSKLVFDVNNKVRKRTAPKSFAAFLAKDLKDINRHCDQFVDIIRGKFGGEIYMNENCTIENFKTHAKDYNVLDLVMHGDGEAGALTFNYKQQLFDIDIYDLDLSNTQLIYLTACETNVGILQKGEGIMSLSRAFTYSGCPTLVSTLWSVRTESTCLISKLFFDEIKNGKPVDKALLEAQRKYIKEVKIDADISAHPYYWAGIIPIGKMEPITFKK